MDCIDKKLKDHGVSKDLLEKKISGVWENKSITEDDKKKLEDPKKSFEIEDGISGKSKSYGWAIEQDAEPAMEIDLEVTGKMSAAEQERLIAEEMKQVKKKIEKIDQIPITAPDPAGKAADDGESFGPAKAEFDSWKRIYKEEEAFEKLGLPPRAHYWRDGEMFSPFGTLSNPVKVYSQFSHRIIGCRGGNGAPHEIVWINLGNKYKTMCPECGQMFMLVNYCPAEAEETGEELNTIQNTQNDGHLKEPQMY